MLYYAIYYYLILIGFILDSILYGIVLNYDVLNIFMCMCIVFHYDTMSYGMILYSII